MLALRRFFEKPARGTLFEAMVDKLRLRGALQSRPSSDAVMKRASERCAGCGREDSCVAWMEGNAEPDEAPYFCKNHDMFERLKHDIEAETVLEATR
jgi:hypothetical protein